MKPRSPYAPSLSREVGILSALSQWDGQTVDRLRHYRDLDTLRTLVIIATRGLIKSRRSADGTTWYITDAGRARLPVLRAKLADQRAHWRAERDRIREERRAVRAMKRAAAVLIEGGTG